jgi:Ca2+-transporting ATPase
MDRDWHALEGSEVARVLGTDLESGLLDGEARDRLERDGPNVIVGEDGYSWFSRLAEQFTDVLIWLLLVAAAISGLILGEWIDTFVILAIVLLNAGLGFVQEYRAERALASLREIAAPDAVVLRNGTVQTVPSPNVVVGDLLVIEAGSKIAADARLLEAVHLEMDEASLTGESLPEQKSIRRVDADAPLGDRECIVFAGTSVTSGRGRALVVATGGCTEVGRIAGALAREEPPTPLQVELDSVGRRLGVLAVVTAALVFLVGWLRGTGAESMFLVAVALAVAAIPEGLPAVVTITLSGGVQRMAERNAVVRRLPAVEALGAASVICSDKTGTITRNEIRVQEVLLADRRIGLDLLDPADRRDRWYLTVAALCNDARRGGDGWIGDPTETALCESVVAAGVAPESLQAEYPRLDEFAFDSGRKRMTTVHRHDGSVVLAVKGAPEEVAARCTMIETGAGPADLADGRRAAVLDVAAGLAERGWRTLALAYRMSSAVPASAAEAESDLVLVAVVGMSDEARVEARPAVEEATKAGITVVMVTGDHEVTARAVARQVGILTEEAVMPGSQLREMTAEELAEDVERYRVYSRIDPLDKVKIVEAWRARGRIVAMTGDGVNDAPALRAADIGVAMGSGTDVAREASAMILTDDNFATIVAAVREGRSIFTNLRTVVSFLLGSNASEVLLMFLGFLVFGALGEPLLATQLLWINLVTDGLPALALGVDPPDPQVMDRGPDTSRRMLHGRRLLTMGRHGATMAVSGLGALAVSHYVLGYEWALVRTVVFSTLVVTQLAYALLVRRPPRPARPRRNRILLVSVVASLALQALVVHTKVGQTLFDTVALPIAGWVVVAAAVAVAAAGIVLGDRLTQESVAAAS